MPFIGKNPTSGFSTIVKDDLTPDGSTTAFTLSKQVASANDIAVFVGNVRQEPTDAYSVSGTTLTMTAAPASGINFYVLHIAGTLESSVIPADDTISTAKIQSSAVTDAKIAGMSSSKLTGAMPAIDGSALTGISSGMVKVYDAALTTGVTFQQLDNIFTDDYDNYHINLSVSLAGDGYYYFRFTDSSDSEIGSGSGEYGYANQEIDGGSRWTANTSSAMYPMRNGVAVTGGAGNESTAFVGDIIGVRQSTTPISIQGFSINFNTNGTNENYIFQAGLRPDYFEVVNGLTLTASQNFDGGRISVFGYKTS